MQEKEIKKIIEKIVERNPQTAQELAALKRELFGAHGILPENKELLAFYNKYAKGKNENLKSLLIKRKVRTISGVAPIAVLTKPYKCPGKCAYCPSEKEMPKSYLSNEPAVMRAILCDFDPYRQARLRLRALIANGHSPEKIELIIMGGTWSALPKDYQYWYVKECFRAANDQNLRQRQISSSKSLTDKRRMLNTPYCQPKIFSQTSSAGINFGEPASKKILELKKELLKEQKKNEKAKYRIVGLTLETRDDCINGEEIERMREMGATRIEIGAQSVDDKVLKLNRRQSNSKQIARATKLLKETGFKVTYHLMPGLPGANIKSDLMSFKRIFSQREFCPDQIKIYPCVVVKGSLLYRWWKAGKYKPYTNKQLEDLLLKIKKLVPYYVRIIRVIRDIPGESIEAGNKISNLREVLARRLAENGEKCKCIRCRESREKEIEEENLQLFCEEYKASSGKEFFLSYEDKKREILYAFLRLRFPAENQRGVYKSFPILKNSVLIRELHTYGKLAPVKSKNIKLVQHQGLGKKLMQEAERRARENGYQKIAVISGIGVREYYRKLGYRLQDGYMVKKLKS